MTEPEKFKLSDILYGLVVPIIVAVVIVIFSAVILFFILASTSPYAFVTVVFTQGLALMVMFGVPVVLGLIWNKWAGGATGFITGTLFYLAYSGYFTASTSVNMYRDPSFIGNYIVGGILVGYIAGALNNKSHKFKRMLGAGLTAALTVGAFQFVLNYTVSFVAWMTKSNPGYALFTALLPMVILGVIGPIIAKVFIWYGIMPAGRA